MNILYLTMSRINHLEQSSIHADLLKEFVKAGDYVVVCAPAEKGLSKDTATSVKDFDGYSVLHVETEKLRGINIIKKGIATLTIEKKFRDAIKKHCADIKFDLVLYTTPPITFAKVIDFVKKRDGAQTYLLLKDIFPQNAVDLGMFSKNGIIYRHFRKKEKLLYQISDYIGCMSEANVRYVIENNRDVNPSKVHVAPNCTRLADRRAPDKNEVRAKFNLPADKKIFIYGGNLGKPQGIPFIIECLKKIKDKSECIFVVCGNGTEYKKLEEFVDKEKPGNIRLINGLPKDEYEELAAACDVGLVFLDHRFTIPNFPSRILSYMQKKMPILACTDVNTDVGKVITEGDFGWWCESNCEDEFEEKIESILALTDEEIAQMGENAYKYLLDNYTADKTYKIILEHIK